MIFKSEIAIFVNCKNVYNKTLKNKWCQQRSLVLVLSCILWARHALLRLVGEKDCVTSPKGVSAGDQHSLVLTRIVQRYGFDKIVNKVQWLCHGLPRNILSSIYVCLQFCCCGYCCCLCVAQCLADALRLLKTHFRLKRRVTNGGSLGNNLRSPGGEANAKTDVRLPHSSQCARYLRASTGPVAAHMDSSCC